VIFVSATPGPYELTKTSGVVTEQIIRPTGLVDPEVEVKPIRGQVDDLLHQIRLRAEQDERVLVTTLTKRMAEDLSEHYTEAGVKCAYLHSEVATLDRVKILRDLRRGVYDVLIGVNLLREGLDLPEVSLVAVLDADKEGFLRSAGSLIQTMGRAARNLNGRVILYADVMTESMRTAMDETLRRRRIQAAYNETHGIIPQTIRKPIDATLVAVAEGDYVTVPLEEADVDAQVPPERMEAYLKELEEKMREAARHFDFKQAAAYRDRLQELKNRAVLDAAAPA
jgi:excinuclease ABC subunit B